MTVLEVVTLMAVIVLLALFAHYIGFREGWDACARRQQKDERGGRK